MNPSHAKLEEPMSEKEPECKPVYLDHHSTTPCAPEVVKAMQPCFTETYGNPSAVNHDRGRKASEQVYAAKEKIAALLNTIPEAITITAGATESNNIAILGLADAAPEGRDEIIMSPFEHPSVRNPVLKLEERGFTVKTLPITKDGFVDPEVLRETISDRTLLVTVMAANHEIGTVQDIKSLAQVAHDAGALFHTDATQAVGKVPVDVADADVDMLSLSGHKFYGPPGVGALYVRQKPPLDLHPVMFGGGQQDGLRSGTIPLALAVGLGEAARVAGEMMQGEKDRLAVLCKRFRDRMEAAIPDMYINGCCERRIPGSLNICFPGVKAADLMLDLADELCLASGSACASGANAPSPVLKALGLSDEDCAASIRISMGRATTETEVDYAAQKLIEAVRAARG